MKKVIEWIRVSTIGQADHDRAGIPSQRTSNRQTCQRFDLEIERTFQISDVSGASVLFSPEMQEMIRLMKSPAIGGVVTREFSRMIRPEDFSDFALLQVFVDTNSILYLPDGPVDFGNKTGRFVGTIRAAMAGMERFEMKERLWDAKEVKRKRGELAQSSIVLPFGVGYEKGRGFFYKPEAGLVQECIGQFLSGNQNYEEIAKVLGVTPRGAHLILRNPIWSGFRVITQRRDPSAAGKYVGIDGRQADRRKIDRVEEDVIRIQVIDKPIITEETFKELQRRMDLKQQNHWRSQTDYNHRFTYNGFLSCPTCGQPIQTAFARRDYYVCKGRRTLHKCRSAYMGRDRLEGILDGLFANQISNPSFIRGCVDELAQRSTGRELGREIQHLNTEIDALRRKRGRVIDSFIEGAIGKPERDQRLAPIDTGIRIAQNTLNQNEGDPAPDIDKLIAALVPLAEWEFWNRDQKRQILSSLAPDIRVVDYKVESLGLNPALFSNKDTHKDTGSLRPPA